MRFDEGTILGIYPNLFTLAVARNCLAFVRRTFHVRVYVRVFTSVQLRFHGVSPENSPERTSRHLAREPLGARPESLHEGRVAVRVLSLPEIESHPRRRGVRKIERIVVASLGRLLTILLLQAGTPSRAWVNKATY